MNFTDLLLGKGIDPQHVLVLRHRPFEPELNKVLPWLAAEKPDVFNAYQQTQGAKLEKVMQRARHVAAFLGREPGRVGTTVSPEIKLHPDHPCLRSHISQGYLRMRRKADGGNAVKTE